MALFCVFSGLLLKAKVLSIRLVSHNTHHESDTEIPNFDCSESQSVPARGALTESLNSPRLCVLGVSAFPASYTTLKR